MLHSKHTPSKLPICLMFHLWQCIQFTRVERTNFKIQLSLFVQFYTSKTGLYGIFPHLGNYKTGILPSKVKMRIKWDCFYSTLLTLQIQSTFYSKPSYYYPMWKDSNVTKLYFKNYKNTNNPQMIPIEQFLHVNYSNLC